MPDDAPATQYPNEQTATAANDEAARRQLLVQRRRAFAEAQEQFAAADFDSARRRLSEIPAGERTPDVQRLMDLCVIRLKEVADVRREIVGELEHERSAKLPDLVQRYLELQPGDEWGNDLRHRLEEQEFERSAPAQPKTAAAGSPSVGRRKSRPRALEPLLLDEPAPVEEFEESAAAEAPASSTVEDDANEELEEIWEFGERMATKSRNSARHNADDEEENRPSIPPEVWITAAAGGAVLLAAFVVGVVFLLVEMN